MKNHSVVAGARAVRTSGLIASLTASFLVGMLGGTRPALADLDDWASHPPGVSNWVQSVTYAKGLYLAASWDGSILSSTDAIHWTRHISETRMQYVSQIAYGKGTFVAVGSGTNYAGVVLTSTDGTNWHGQYSQPSQFYRHVAFLNNLFVVGGVGTILTSSDGSNWITRLPKTPYVGAIGDFAYGNGIFVGGSPSNCWTSANGIAWTNRPDATKTWLVGMTYTNGLFTGVGPSGSIMTSADGVFWASKSSGVTTGLVEITYAEGTYVVVGSAGTILTSTNTDGTGWTKRTSGTTDDLLGIGYGNGKFVAVGGVFQGHGTILAATSGGTGGGLWSGAADLGGGWKWLDWFGYFNTSGDPWIYHQQHGYLYPYGTDTSSISFWDNGKGIWWWTSASTYPYLYRFSDNAWLWYQENSAGPRWFYNITAGKWESW